MARLSPAELLHLNPTPGAHRVAVRAGVSVGVPLLACLAMDRPEWILYAAFGAFTSLYGRNHVHLSRAVMQASAGAALTLAVVAGALLAAADASPWLAVLVAAGLAGLGELLSTAQDWHPPGPIFLVFAFGAVASAPGSADDVPVAAGVAAAAVAFALVVGNVGAVVRRDRSRPARLARVRWWRAARAAVAVLAAGAVATGLSIGHPYWAMVAAVAPLAAADADRQLLRAVHRVAGTLLGLLTA